MGWIQMKAGYPILGNWNRRWMRASAAEKLRQQMGVRTLGALAACRRNGLIDLGSPNTGHKHSMRACFEDGRSCGICDVEQRAPFPRAKSGQQLGRRSAHAHV